MGNSHTPNPKKTPCNVEIIGNLGELVEQIRDDSFSKVEINHDATDNPHEDSEKEISDSIEVKVESVEPTEHLDKGCFRKVGMSEERSSKSKDINDRNYFSGDETCHDTQSKLHETNERKDNEYFELETRVMPTKLYESRTSLRKGKEAS